MIDWNKPLQTKHGIPARLIGRVTNRRYPRVVAITHQGNVDGESAENYTEDGTYVYGRCPHAYDLINVKQKFSVTVFANCYPESLGGGPTVEIFRDKEKAQDRAVSGALEVARPIEILFEG